MYVFKTLSLVLSLLNSCHAFSHKTEQHIPWPAAQYAPFLKSCSTASSSKPGPVNKTLAYSAHYGSLVLNQTKVISDLSVFGSFIANQCDFDKNLTCYGSVVLKGDKNTARGIVTVKGTFTADSMAFEDTVEIFGYMQAHECTFKRPIVLYTSKVNLKNTEVNNITIHDQSNSPVTIKLDNVKLAGKITINSGQGIVLLKNSEISSQQIIGCSKITHIN